VSSRFRFRSAAALGVALLALLLASCAPASSGTADPPATTASAGPVPPDETGTTDGPVDPTQETQRSGPAVDFGGPPFGAQGDPEPLEEGSWCATVGFFWGGEALPQNVTFTVTGIVVDPEEALTAERRACGSVGAEQSCIGFVMTPDTPFTLCSMQLTATDAYPGRAEVGFTGTLECTEPFFCDAAIAREAEQGPPLVVGG
jgi:hypothetical protein